MNTTIIAKVTVDGKLEIPPEVLEKLQPYTEYEVSVTEDEIVFKKNKNRFNTKGIKTTSNTGWFRSKSTNSRRN